MADNLITWAKRGSDGSLRKAKNFLFLQDITLPKLLGTMLDRYQNRHGGYTRVIKCGRNPKDQSPLAILEYVDAPGDTMVELSKLQLPAISHTLKTKMEELEKIKLLKEYDLHPREKKYQFQKLTNLVHQLTKVERKLTDIAALRFLPENYKEEKFPAKDEQIVAERKVWREPVERLDFDGNLRYAIRSTKELRISKRLPSTPKRKLVNRHLAV